MTQRLIEKRILSIGMIDADLLDGGTRHPNLAQMKMSRYCKSRGHNVRLIYHKDDVNNLNQFDALIISKVFSFTNLPKTIELLLPKDSDKLKQFNSSIKETIEFLEDNAKSEITIMIGGTGFFNDSGRSLDYEIEHIMPDYDLYVPYVNEMISKGRAVSEYDDYLNYSIGFTTRGCFRKCDFCVNKKYNRAFKHSPVKEFYDPNRPMIYLWDDNFFAYFEGWESILDELIELDRPFQFRQGLDIRLIKEKHAQKLSKCKYHGDFIFAFDHPEPDQQELIKSKLKLWRQYCNKTTKLYVLCAFDPQNKWDGKSDFTELELEDIVGIFQRIQILMYFGCLPYIMRYEFYKKSQFKGLYTQIARWCNQPQFFKKMSFKEFCYANQRYSTNQFVKCASLKAYESFDNKYHEIAEKYFNLKFEEENRYKWVNAYYHQDTKPCILCDKKRTWDCVCNGAYTSNYILSSYLMEDLDFLCFAKERFVECTLNHEKSAKIIISTLLNSSYQEMLDVIDKKVINLSIKDIPQFGDVLKITQIVEIVNKGANTYLELGRLLDDGEIKSDVSRRKFGETHAKLAAMMDLIWIRTNGNQLSLSTTPLGVEYLKLDFSEQIRLLDKLILRISIIQKILQLSKNERVNIKDVIRPCSDNTTNSRRSSDVMSLIESLKNTGDPCLLERLNKVVDNN